MQLTGENLLDGLLMASAKGDQHAFAELYRLTAPRLKALVIRLTANPGDAGEAVQEAYVRIWNRASRFDPARGAAIHWMAAIARNIAIDFLRARGRASLPLDEVAELRDPLPFETADMTDVRRCVSLLEPPYDRVIIFAFYLGYSHTELASRLDTPLGTIKSWVRRGLSQLKECLGSHGN